MSPLASVRSLGADKTRLGAPPASTLTVPNPLQQLAEAAALNAAPPPRAHLRTPELLDAAAGSADGASEGSAGDAASGSSAGAPAVAASAVVAGHSSMARAQSVRDAETYGGAAAASAAIVDTTGRRVFAATKLRAAHEAAAAAAAAATADSGALPPGWRDHFSRTHSAPYWRNEETKETSWERPSLEWTADAQGGDDGHHGGGHYADGDGDTNDDGASSVPATEASIDQPRSATVFDDGTEAEAIAEEASLPPLPEGWVAAYSRSRKTHFYVHAERKLKTWVRPAALEEPLPPGYSAVWSRSLKTYYFRHDDTGAITYTRPTV